MKRIFVRGIISLVLLAIWGWLEGLVNVTSPLVTGQAATWQFENSNVAYIASQYGMRYTPIMNGVIDLVMILVLIGIWWGVFRARNVTAAMIGGLFLIGLSAPSFAYYDTVDYPEWDNILPNESAFLIPVVGANKDSQMEFGSIDYLRENKVAAKRIQIPHTVLNGSGWVKNSVIPSAVLVLIDRSPYQREWNKDPAKGTSGKDEGFRCESRDSYGITTALTIAAYVTEPDAPQFLYHFGVNPPEGKRDEPKVIFTSVVQGRSLAQVMDSNVRGKVHAVLCSEMAKYDLNAANQDEDLFRHKADIIASVYKQTQDLYKPMGITIEYLGFSDELTYAPEIQTAINRVFIASKDREAAMALQSALPVLQAEADMEIKKGLAKGLAEKGLPALPSILMDPKTIVDMLGSFFKTDGLAATAPIPPVKH